MDNSNFLLRFFVFRIFAENEGAGDPTRAGVVGALLAQAVGLPLGLILTRALVTQSSEPTARTPVGTNKRPAHAKPHTSPAHETAKAHK
jgi:hypothetical protein